MKRINAEVTELLHAEFKARCAQQGAQMEDVIVDLISAYVFNPTAKPVRRTLAELEAESSDGFRNPGE